MVLLDHIQVLKDEKRRDAIDLRYRFETGDALLHVWVLENVPTTVKLISLGAGVDEKYREGVAALHLAYKMGGVQIADIWLKTGADAILEQGDDPYLIRITWHNGHSEVARFLLRYRCDVNQPVIFAGRYEGFSALMFTARLANVERAEMIIDTGTDLNHVKGDGYTALLLTVPNGNAGTVQFAISFQPVLISSSQTSLTIIRHK